MVFENFKALFRGLSGLAAVTSSLILIPFDASAAQLKIFLNGVKASVTETSKPTSPMMDLVKVTRVPRDQSGKKLTLYFERKRPSKFPIEIRINDKSVKLEAKKRVWFPIPFSADDGKSSTLYQVELKSFGKDSKTIRFKVIVMKPAETGAPGQPPAFSSSSSQSNSNSSAITSSSPATSSSAQSSSVAATPVPTPTATATPVPCREGVLLGDINLDRIVDSTDLSLVTSNFGLSVANVPTLNVDLSRNGTIDTSDLLEVQQNMGAVGCPIVWSNSFEIWDGHGGFSGRPSPFFAGAHVIVGLGWNLVLEDGSINESYLRQTVRTLPTNQLVYIDIENWSVDIRIRQRSLVTETLNKFIQAIGWIREERPDLRLGMYAMAPLSDLTVTTAYGNIQEILQRGASDPMYAWAQSAVGQARINYNRWQEANDFLRPLAEKVDVLFPSLYIAAPTSGLFPWFAKAEIAEAHRYGKPVLPFLWPRFHQAGPYSGQYVDASETRQQYESCREHGAEGFVMWDWMPSTTPWQNFPWLQELQDFYNHLP